MSDKFGDERDPYLYPALNVLRNRLGIRQAKNLQQAGDFFIEFPRNRAGRVC